MARKKQVDFTQASWQGQLYTTLTGAFGRALVEGDPYLKSQINKTIWYDEETQTYVGSNYPIVTRVDTIAKELSGGAVRAVSLQDTDNSTFRRIFLGKYYADVPELIIQTSKEKGQFANINNPLIERIGEIARDRGVKFEFPCKVEGIDAIFDIGWKVTARDDFKVVQHDSLDYKHNGERFTFMENGFPVFEKDGSYIWFLRSEGAARVYRNSDFNVGGDDDSLLNSYRSGRVALTIAEGGAPEISAGFVRKLEEEYRTQQEEVEQKFVESMKVLTGNK